ncbi:MAG: FAD-dependent oxidoreductase, partial [Chloroflexota bacterium]
GRIAFLQCVGSRDQSHDYCSAVCCMYATKEAVMAKEHQPDLDVHVFMMDMRAFSKGYWGYFERARDRYGVRYTRCRISALREDPVSGDLLLRYADEGGALHQERFDLAVLSVGMEISQPVRELGRRLSVELDEYGFCHTALFDPLETSRPGIYAVGPFREPKDIPESVIEASGAAAAAAARLSAARFTLTVTPEFPPERDVRGEDPRIGVFVCHCGSNIGGYLNVPGVAEYARTLPGVVHAEDNLYTCSQDSIKHIAEQIAEHRLNRVVVASCTPLTHQPLFQDCLRSAGLNPYLFEMANIRNQCSWVHSDDWEVATVKARDLVRMAVARAALLAPQRTVEIPVQRAGLVVGGGAAGMAAALSLADQGFPVHLVEREAALGGNLRHVFVPRNGSDPQQVLRALAERVSAHPLITLHLGSQIVASSGFMGSFSSVIAGPDGERLTVQHGATILATGAQEYRGSEYGYGSDPRIITQQEFEARLAAGDDLPGSVVMIQCVGPAEQYCSRICCTVALKNALALKQRQPDAQVVILYRDIRTYGFKERLYTQAREQGVIFVRYDDAHRPQVAANGDLTIRAWDLALRRDLLLRPDLLVLSMPAVPREDAHQVAGLFKANLDADGFFLEAHVKLRPVDFASDGVFMAGMAHYPKLLDETLIQAGAAAARAARVLSRETLAAGGRVAVVDEAKCTGCLTCVRICPFDVPRIAPAAAGVGGILGAAHIEAAVCQGCGSCVAECPAQAIQLMHYTDAQLAAKVRALFAPPPGFIPLAQVGELT